jgi:hypothetical protein
MVELFILWNVAAARADRAEDDDFTASGLLPVWAMLQLFIWPLSLFFLLWQKLGLRWYMSLITASAITAVGYLKWGENFYFLIGFISVFAAVCVIAYEVVSDS